MKNRNLRIAGVVVLILAGFLYWNFRPGGPVAPTGGTAVEDPSAADTGKARLKSFNPEPESKSGLDPFPAPDYPSLQALKRSGGSGSGAVVTGYILTEDEQPVPDATIDFYLRRDPVTLEFAIPLASTTSRSDGSYSQPLDAPMEAWIQVQKAGSLGAESPLSLESAGLAHRNFTLLRATTRLSGTVVDALEEIPLAGARVRVKLTIPLQQILLERSTLSDAWGRFEFDALSAGSAELTASAQGYIEDVQLLMLAAGNPGQIQLRVVRTHLTGFRVTDSAGYPIAQAYIERPDRLIARTDDRGKVEFPIVAMKPFSCKVWADGYLTETFRVDPHAPPTRVILKEGKTIRGRVISERGLPIPGARIAVWARDVRESTYESHCLSDGQGYFTLRVSRHYLSRIHASCRGFVNQDLTFEKDDDPDFVEIRMQASESALSGRVLGLEGRPVRRFAVTLSRPSGGPGDTIFFGEVDRIDGGFLIEDLPAGQFQMIVQVIGAESGEMERHLEEVRLLPGRVTELTIRLSDF